MNDLFAFIAFVANLIFFIWFGSTLSGIYSESKRTNALLELAISRAHQAGTLKPPPTPQG
jgi:hypothetical protein